MNTKQQKFVTEYLQWGIPSLAYANAYNKPDPNGRAIESAANRLLRNPEVKQAIHDAEDRIRHQVEREIADRQALDVFTIEQKRHLLKQIATGDMLVEQRYKTGDCRHCTQFVRPTINQMLRAIDLDNRMSAHYPPPQHKTTTKRSVLVATTDKDINTATANKKSSFPARLDNISPAFIPPTAGGAGGKLAPDNPEQQRNTITDNISPLRARGNPTPDNPEQQPNAVSSLPSLKKTSALQQNTTTDNTSLLPGAPIAIGVGVIAHDELMELLYPKEEKLQHFTTTGLKRNRL